MKESTQIPKFESVRFFSTRVRLKFDSALDDESCVQLLATVMKNSSVKLEPFTARDQDRPADLSNSDELEKDKRIHFSILDPSTLDLRFRAEVPVTQMKQCIKSVFEAAFKVERLQVSGIDFADVVHIFDVKHIGNHNALLSEIYHEGSLLEKIFEKKEIFSSDIAIGGLVSRKNWRQCVVLIRGATGLREILSEDYDKDEIDVMVGYAQQKNIPRSEIGDFLVNLLEDARQYLVSNVLYKIVKPLDDKITQIKGD